MAPQIYFYCRQLFMNRLWKNLYVNKSHFCTSVCWRAAFYASCMVFMFENFVLKFKYVFIEPIYLSLSYTLGPLVSALSGHLPYHECSSSSSPTMLSLYSYHPKNKIHQHGTHSPHPHNYTILLYILRL